MADKKNWFGRKEMLMFLFFLLIMAIYLCSQETDWVQFLRHLLKNLIRNLF